MEDYRWGCVRRWGATGGGHIEQGTVREPGKNGAHMRTSEITSFFLYKK